MSKFEPLGKEFYLQPTLEVATQLLGKALIFNDNIAVITETEAYFGLDDAASHAFKGRTNRTEVMFFEGGYSYVYFIYGMYNCLNFVTEAKDFPAAVLIRGANLISPDSLYINGPGKLCKILGITKEHNAINITKSDNFFVANHGVELPYIATTRIGITKNTDKLWRFVVDPKYFDVLALSIDN